MELGTLLFLLLILACPLMMVWMMRGHGRHGGHASHGAEHAHADDDMPDTGSLDSLRRKRDELEVEIEQLEQSQAGTKTPVDA